MDNEPTPTSPTDPQPLPTWGESVVTEALEAVARRQEPTRAEPQQPTPQPAYDPPPPDMSLEEQVRHARGFAAGICRNDHHVSRLLEQMARSIEHLAAAAVSAPTAAPQPDKTPGQTFVPQWAMDEAYRLITEHTWGWEESASDDLTADQEQHWHDLAHELAEICERREAAAQAVTEQLRAELMRQAKWLETVEREVRKLRIEVCGGDSKHGHAVDDVVVMSSAWRKLRARLAEVERERDSLRAKVTDPLEGINTIRERQRIEAALLKQASRPTEHGEWYIFADAAIDKPLGVYLHSDGVWRQSMQNIKTACYTGWYRTKEEAELVLQAARDHGPVTIGKLQATLTAERAAREQAERERDQWKERAECAEAAERTGQCDAWWAVVAALNSNYPGWTRLGSSGTESATKAIAALQQRAEAADKLLAIIREVHSQHADDLCWMPADVNRIFEAAGLPPQDLHVGDKAAMRRNCDRYIDCLHDGGPWVSYAELEQSVAQLRAVLEEIVKAITKMPPEWKGIYTTERPHLLGWLKWTADWDAKNLAWAKAILPRLEAALTQARAVLAGPQEQSE